MISKSTRVWARKIVDKAFNEATESETVPSTDWADKIIDSCGMPMQWTTESAMSFIRQIQPHIMETGYYVALAGGVLNKGFSNNDLDIVLVPRRGNSRPDKAIKLLRELLSDFGNVVVEPVPGGTHLTFKDGPNSLPIEVAVMGYETLTSDVEIPLAPHADKHQERTLSLTYNANRQRHEFVRNGRVILEIADGNLTPEQLDTIKSWSVLEERYRWVGNRRSMIPEIHLWFHENWYTLTYIEGLRRDRDGIKR